MECLSDAGFEPADDLPTAIGLARAFETRVAMRHYKGDTYLAFDGSGDFKPAAEPVLAVYRQILPKLQMSIPEEEEPPTKSSGFSLFGKKDDPVEDDDGSETREEIE